MNKFVELMPGTIVRADHVRSILVEFGTSGDWTVDLYNDMEERICSCAESSQDRATAMSRVFATNLRGFQ